MKTVISIVLVCLGLGVDPNGSQNADIALSLCFFFGAINLVKPAVSALGVVSNAVVPKKPIAERRTHH